MASLLGLLCNGSFCAPCNCCGAGPTPSSPPHADVLAEAAEESDSDEESEDVVKKPEAPPSLEEQRRRLPLLQLRRRKSVAQLSIRQPPPCF